MLRRWIKFPRPYSFSKTADGASMISQTTVTPTLTQTRTCTCYPPGRFERQEDPAGATDLIRCGCALPVGGTYDPKARSCGCPAISASRMAPARRATPNGSVKPRSR